MNMVKRLLAVTVSAYIVWGGWLAWATSIEGVTPSGYMRTVGVSEDGQLSITGAVIISTSATTVITVQGTSPAGTPVTVSLTGPITSTQGTYPWSVVLATPIASIPVITTQTFTTTAGNISTTLTLQVSVAAGGPVLVYPADAARKQGAICNDTDGEAVGYLNVWLGDATVTTGTGKLLKTGQCYSPDSPASMVGAIYAASTATATVGYIYHR